MPRGAVRKFHRLRTFNGLAITVLHCAIPVIVVFTRWSSGLRSSPPASMALLRCSGCALLPTQVRASHATSIATTAPWFDSTVGKRVCGVPTPRRSSPFRTQLRCREAHRRDPARVPGSAAPLMGPPATQVECIKSPAHNGAAAQGLLAQMLRILLHARNYAPKRSPCIFSVLAGIHCEYSLALALEDRIVAHHNFEAPEMLPSGTLHGRLGCDNLQAGAGAAPAPDATPNTARLAGLGCATDRGRLDTLSSRPRARALTSINFACASVAVGP
jgi:hypothetical protein